VSGMLPSLLLALMQAAAQQPSTPSRPPSTPPTQRPTVEIPDVLITEDQADAVPGQTPLHYPAGRDLIAPAEIREAGALNVQELLRRSPGIQISEETGSDSLPNIALRGVTGNDGIFRAVNVAMFADGIPLAGGPYGAPGASGFPLLRERVFAIDIMRGGAATRYGPNNVSGIINFLTRPIPEGLELETRLSYDSENNAAGYLASGGTFGSFGYLLEGVYKDGDSYREHGEYTLQNYSLKTRYGFSDTFRAMLQVESFEDDSNLSDGLSLAQYEADPWQSTSLQNRFAANQRRANAELEWDLGADTRLELISYYYETERTFWLGSPLFYGNSPTFIQATPRPMHTSAIQPQLTHHYSALGSDAELVTGLRYQHENLVRRVERTPAGGATVLRSDDRFDYDAWSAFAQNRFDWERLSVTPGIRLESVGIEGERVAGNQPGVGNTNKQDFVEVLPAISAAYRLAENWSVYSNIQSSFQPPAANQLELATSNPQEVEAQYAWMYEAGTRVQTEDELLALDLTIYQIDYSDRLEPDPDQFDVLLNSGRSRHRGVELAVDSRLDAAGLKGVSLFANAAYNESEYRNGDFEGNETTGSPDWLLSWGTRYEHETTGVFAMLDGAYVGEAYSDRENTEAISADGTRGLRPSFTLWNAHVGWRRELSEQLSMHLQVDLRNLFDEQYFDIRAARGIYPGAPFSYGAQLGFQWSF